MNAIKAFAIAIIAVFAPAKAMILSSMALIFVDLVTGVWASKKQNIPITSAGLRQTISKLVIYEVAILLAFLAQQYLLDNSIQAASIVSGMIGITELTSCLENLNIIGGNNLLQSIITKLGSSNQPPTPPTT